MPFLVPVAGRRAALALASLLVGALLPHHAVAGNSPAMSSTPSTASTLQPPVAARKPHVVTSPHGDREDPYYWLRDDERKNPEMLAYLEAENAYRTAMMAPVRELEERLYGEMLAGRVDPRVGHVCRMS